MIKIAIIGGGVIGFSCAVVIAERFKSFAEIVLFADKFTPATTGDGSAGLWGPYMLGDTPAEKIIDWSRITHEFFYDLWKSTSGSDAGVCLIPVMRATTEDTFDTPWKNIVYGYSDMTNKQLDQISKLYNKKYKAGCSFVSFTAEPQRLLPFLMNKFLSANGKIIHKKIDNLKFFCESEPYDVIINCTGLGSKLLVPDNKVYPSRGQVMRVNASWIYNVFLDESDDGNYIIPNYDSVVLGGTHQIGDYNTQPSKADSDFIRKGCEKIIPGLKNIKQQKEWVGLRPGRKSVRVESEICENGKLLIHNYGHGGSGVTLCWGCAHAVLDILLSQKKSKL